MKCRVYINDIPFEEAPEELKKKLNEKIRKALKKHLGLYIPEKEE